MSCINPFEWKVMTKFQGNKIIKIDCRHCLNCMIKRQQQIEFLCKKELNTVYRSGRSAAFVTLTYDDNHIPFNDNGFITLKRKDVQDFMKNMRRQMDYYQRKIPFKYIYCGEYGDGSHSTSKTGISTHRPHYHIVFLGLSAAQVRMYTRKLWKHGLCDVGELSAGGIRYLCKYMTKACPDKDVKAFRHLCNVQNPFFCHSIGIGKEWIKENLYKIVDDGFTFSICGKKQLFPAYVLHYVTARTGISYKPYVRKFMQEEELRKVHASGLNYTQYDFEKSYVQHKILVHNLRSKNMPVNDVTLSKCWTKPIHSLDRAIKAKNLALSALDVGACPKGHTWNDENHEIFIPRRKDGGVNWDLYLYGDYVPF